MLNQKNNVFISFSEYNTTMGNNTSRDGVAAIAAQMVNVALGKEDARSFEMEAVPMELWEVIFSFTEDDTLAIAVPQINKYTRNLAHPNCGIWRAKCKSKGIEAPNKNMTWKKRYFTMQFKMFPLLGHLIGEATYDQLLQHPGATAGTSGSSRYVTIDKHNFWVDDKSIFTHMYIARGIYPIQKEWEAFGITWERSWLDYKDLFKRWNGNFKVEVAPHYRMFQEKPCFSARLTTVARHSENSHYQIDLNFNYSVGVESSQNTLYSISISSHNYIAASNYKKIYDAGTIVDKPAELNKAPVS